jgi:hypothetical protein
MATTLTYTHNNQTVVITLPGDLNWEDEFKWSPVTQSREYAISGSMIVQEWVKQVGRPITLKGGDDRSWITKPDVIKLQTLASLPGKEVALLLGDGRAFTVILDHSGGNAFESAQVFNVFPHTNDDFFVIQQLKMVTVA